MPINWGDVPGFLEPRLTLFFSVDLVGSTSLKQKGEYPLKSHEEATFKDLGASWFAPIAKFYGDVDRQFAISWRNCEIAYKNALHGKELDIKPELWKTNGDELVYTVVLNKAEHVAYVLAAWTKALRNYRNDLIKQNHDLDVKGTAWLAGFPTGLFSSDHVAL